jgi:hypothetical protein
MSNEHELVSKRDQRANLRQAKRGRDFHTAEAPRAGDD